MILVEVVKQVGKEESK